MGSMLLFIFFFFQAEDGIRDRDVTGVQTCALPISGLSYGFEVAQPRTRVEEASRRKKARVRSMTNLRARAGRDVTTIARRALGRQNPSDHRLPPPVALYSAAYAVAASMRPWASRS